MIEAIKDGEKGEKGEKGSLPSRLSWPSGGVAASIYR